MAFGRLATLLIDIVINSKNVVTQLNQVQQQTQRTASSMQVALGGVGKSAAGFYLVNQAVRLVVGTVETAVGKFADLEKQILDIQKVARFENFSGFAKGFIELGTSLRGVSFKQLAEIGGDLARLGVRGGQAQFLDFLKVAAQFAQTTGDIDTRQAGEGLGKLLQNFGKDLNATEALRMASAVNKLADEFAVTSGEILTITQKLSGFADAVGLSAQETLGLVTLIKQTGISSTVVESSLTRLFTVMESDPRKVAESLGLAGDAIDQFVIDVKARPIEAVQQFFSVLNSMPIDQAVGILKELELATSRNAVALLNATNRMADWNKTQEAAVKGSENSVNLLQKYADTADSVSAQIDQLKNSWDVFIAGIASSKGILSDIIFELRMYIDAMSMAASDKNITTKPPLQLGKSPKELIAQRISINQRMISETNALEGAKSGEEFWLSKVLNRRTFAKNMAKMKQELDAVDEALNRSLDAEVSARKEKAEKQKQITEKQKEALAAMAKELEGNRKLWQERGSGAFLETTKEQSIRERFEGIAKEEKKLYTGKGANEMHLRIDHAKDAAIEKAIKELHEQTAEAILSNLRKLQDKLALPSFALPDNDLNDFSKNMMRLQEWFDDATHALAQADLDFPQFADELNNLNNRFSQGKSTIHNNAVDKAEKDRFAFVLGLGTSGRFAEIYSKTKQLDGIIKQYPAGFGLGGLSAITDLIFNKREPPQIRGLNEAYKDAIVNSGQQEIDERIAADMEKLVAATIENKDLQKALIDETKKNRPKGAVK